MRNPMSLLLLGLILGFRYTRQRREDGDTYEWASGCEELQPEGL
jgi:hypothetical protein